ncbi:MAG TPA: NAD-dependent epimerase/dehydratase family protein [Polyangiaceae bacterium]
MVERALVTGATGFLGGRLVLGLLERGWAVRAMIRKDSASLPSQVERAHADLTVDDGAVERAVESCDVVFHCAGVVGDRVTWDLGRAVNVEGTRRVARAAKDRARAFVHVSSVAVYGFDAGTFDERAPRRTVGEPYIDTKTAGEEACEAELAASTTALRILRPSIIYGPGDTGMLPRLIDLLRNRVPMIGDGGAPVGLVHVSDVVGGLLAAAAHEGDSCVFNVAGAPDEDVTWKELVDMLCERLCLPQPRTMPLGMATVAARAMHLFQKVGLISSPPLTPFAVRFLTETRRYPIARMRLELGVAPRVKVHAGLGLALDRFASALEPTPALV